MRYHITKSGTVYATPSGGVPDNCEPVVVLNPEDREQVREVLAAYGRQFTDWTPELDSNVTRLQAALRSLITPPRPDEPTGLGAVVEDDKGVRWIKIDDHSDCNDWACVGAPKRNDLDTIRWRYADITAVRILSEGVQP